MTTLSQILYVLLSTHLTNPFFSEGLTDSYTSTGTLSRILQQVHRDYQDENDDDDEEFEYEEIPPARGEEGGARDILEQGEPLKKGRCLGPKMERVLEDDEFIPELRLKNEHLVR